MAKSGLTPGDITRIAKMVEKLIQSRIISVTDSVIGDVQVIYNLCTTTLPDSSHKFWYGPVSICDDSTVTIGDGATAEIEDNVVTMERV